MTDETKQIYEKVNDIQERTARIEVQTERIARIEGKAQKAYGIAEKADIKAEHNKNNIKTLWGFISGIVVALIGTLIKVLLG